MLQPDCISFHRVQDPNGTPNSSRNPRGRKQRRRDSADMENDLRKQVLAVRMHAAAADARCGCLSAPVRLPSQIALHDLGEQVARVSLKSFVQRRHSVEFRTPGYVTSTCPPSDPVLPPPTPARRRRGEAPKCPGAPEHPRIDADPAPRADALAPRQLLYRPSFEDVCESPRRVGCLAARLLMRAPRRQSLLRPRCSLPSSSPDVQADHVQSPPRCRQKT